MTTAAEKAALAGRAAAVMSAVNALVPDDAASPPPPSPPVSGAYPAWRIGKAIGVPLEIPNTANMAPTTPWQPPYSRSDSRNIIDAWNGLARGGSTWYSSGSGGHGDWQNATLAIDLSADAPHWMMLDPGSVYADANLTAAYYADKRPTSAHTYWSNVYVAKPRDGIARIMRFTSFATYGVGAGVPGAYGGGSNVDGFRLDTNRWDSQDEATPGQFWQPSPIFTSAPVSVAKHPVTEDVYVAASYALAVWRVSTGLWTMLLDNPPRPPQFLSGEGYPTLIDSKRNRWVLLHDGESYYNAGVIRLQLIDLSNPAAWPASFSELPLSGSAPADPIKYSAALTWDQDGDRYLVKQGTNVYAINPTTGASSIVAQVPDSFNGPYSRFEYFPALGGVAYLPAFSSNIIFIPTR
jgi:hypothetical protein